MTRNPSLTAFNQTETDRLASDHVAVREPLRPSKARSSSKASRPESSQGVAGSLWKALRTPTSSALARESILAIFDQAVVSGTSFATAVVVGRLLSQESLGIYYLAFTVVVLARGVQEQLVSSPCKVFLQRCEGMERRQYSGSVFVHHALVAAVTVLGLALVLLAGLGPSELSPVLSVLLVAGPLLLLRDFIRQLCFAELRPFEAIRIDIVVAVLQLGGLAVLAVLDLLSVAAIYAVMGAACLLPAGLWFVSSRREPIQWRLGRIGRDWITNWSFGRWALMSFLLVSTSPYVVPWLIVTVQGKAATGMWAACMTLVNAANVLVIGVGNYLTSRAAHAYAAGGVAKLRRVLWSIGLPVLTCLAGFMGLATLFGEAAAVFVFGPHVCRNRASDIPPVRQPRRCGNRNHRRQRAMGYGQTSMGLRCRLVRVYRNGSRRRHISDAFRCGRRSCRPTDGYDGGILRTGLQPGVADTVSGRSIAIETKQPSRNRRDGREDSMTEATPKVTVGMPVYNGEKFLREAIDAILAQTFEDFELVISDNGSTDGTEAMCREYGSRDPRVRYLRADRNHGVVWNFNRVFNEARGEYFKWAAYDDVCAPAFIARCVEVLDQHPDVVWCHPLSKPIDAQGKSLTGPAGEIISYTTAPGQSESETGWQVGGGPSGPTREADEPDKRFQAVVLGPGMVYDLYGLIRTSALRRSGLHRPFFGSDKVLIAELSLLGRFVEIPEVLFFPRCHERQFVYLPSSRALAAGITGRKASFFVLPRRFRCTWSYFVLAVTARISLRERLGCLSAFAQFVVQPKKWRRLAVDVARRLGFHISVPEDIVQAQFSHTERSSNDREESTKRNPPSFGDAKNNVPVTAKEQPRLSRKQH